LTSPDAATVATSQSELASRTARTFEQSPEQLALLHSLVVSHIQLMFPTGTPTVDEVAARQPEIHEAIEQSPPHAAALREMAAQWEKLGGPNTQSHEVHADAILLAIGAGLVLGAIIVGAVCLVIAAKD
jgi:hypothetical protein